MVQLFGNPFNLQGGSGNLQGGYNPQATANPQQAYNPVAPVPQAPKPAPKPVTTIKPKAVATAPTQVPTAQPIQINPAYAQYVQTRPSPSNPGVLEYFNPQNGIGFSNPNDVFNYLRTMTGQSFNNLSQLSAPQNGQPGLPPISYAPTDPNQSLAQSAGLGGLSFEDYQKIIAGQSGLSQAEKDQIRQSLGLPALQDSIFSTPSKTTTQLFNDAYASAGLAELKAQIAAKMKEVNTRQQQYTDKAGTVNENPFLSEASRMGRLRVLDDKKLADIGNLNDEVNSLKDLYNAGLNEVGGIVTRSTADFSANQILNQQKLDYLTKQAEEQISNKQNEKASVAYSYLPDFLKAKAKAQKPDTIGSNETGYFRWNPNTGTFEQVVGPQVTPNYQANPLTGELFNTKDGSSIGGGNIAATLAQAVANNPAAYGNLTTAQQALVNNYLAQQGQAIPGKPATDAQNQSAGYATRIQQASQVIDSLESAIAGYNAVGFQAQLKLPSYLQSTQVQQYQQAALNLIGAKLRKESGAAISQTEYDNAYAQYLPRAGDSAAVLAQKRQNRATILQGEIQNAGPAYNGGRAGGNANDPLGLFSSAGNASASNARTDRHNNPAAFTTDIAKQAGLKLGVDYTIGDPFPNNSNLRTARLIGDPVSQTIKVIDQIGFYTQSGQPRWSYTNSIPQTKNWSKLSYSQKSDVIKQMYAHEGGKALLNNFA